MRRLPVTTRYLSLALLLAGSAAASPLGSVFDEGEADAEPSSASPLLRTPEALVQRVRGDASLPLPERMAAISQPWVGTTGYLLGALGEGGGVDPQPVTRYDVFDCLTFVEEVLALALSPDPARAHEVRMELRYRGGEPWTYENRRHFMLSEWIPGTIEEGWVEDITATLPGAVPRSKTVSAQTWAGWRPRASFPLADERLPVGTMDFHLWPLDAAEESLDAVPPGALVFTVRALWEHLPIAITHVGILVPGTRPTLRHASRLGQNKGVKDSSFAWYTEHQRSYDAWPVEGYIVLMPLEQGPRRVRAERAP